MLCRGTLHECESAACGDQRHRAITMFDAPPHGVLVWAGHLAESAMGKAPQDIVCGDYSRRQTISFMDWHHVWTYFAGTEFHALALRHRGAVEGLYGGNLH
jgi:hypothetical protein